MSSDVIEPSYGAPVSHGPASHEPPPHHAPPPPPPPSTSTSSDDLTASLIEARPDPLLGEFHSDPVPEPQNVEDDSPLAHLADPPAVATDIPDWPSPPLEGDTNRADALNALSSLHVNADDLASANVSDLPDTALVDPLTGLDLTMPSIDSHHAPGAVAQGTAPARAATPAPADDDDDDDDEPESGMSLGTLLLLSYASAVTLGLIWILWTGRRIREDVADIVPTVDSRPDPGKRADGSRRIAPPKPIPAANLADLGKTIRIGQIEATPLAIVSGPVELERNFTERETKPGGANTLKLKLRLKNVSNDLVLAPFDEAFVRDRLHADPDSSIETKGGGAAIAMFPLAVESEWSIVGQPFRELKPGETLETIVVSEPESTAKLAPEMIWRIRLRTDLNHTEDLGVRFRADDVKPGL